MEVPVALLLVAAFFIGPMKLMGAGWVGYALPDALALGTILIVFCERAVRRQPLFTASPLTIPILLLAGLCFLELANPEAPFVRSALGLRSWMLYVGFFFVGYYCFRSSRQLGRLYTLLLALGCVTAAYGVYQWRVGPEGFASWSEDYGQYARIMWSAGVFRAFSTFVLPNAFGSSMGLLMLVAFSIAASQQTARRWRVAAGFGFGLMGMGLAASGTRAPAVELVLAGVIGVTALPGKAGRYRLGITAAGLGIVALLMVVSVIGPAIGVRYASLLDPTEFFWKWFRPLGFGIQIAAAHPFGMGLGYTGGTPHFINNPVLLDLPTKVIDSGYGSAAAETGFVGLLIFAYFAVRVGIEGIRAWRRLVPGRLKDLLLAPALFAALYPAIGLLGGNHAVLPESVYYWLLIGILMKANALGLTGNVDRKAADEALAR